MKIYTINNTLDVISGIVPEKITLTGGASFIGAYLGEEGRGRIRLYVPFVSKTEIPDVITEGNVYFNKHGYPRIRTDQVPEVSKDEALVFFYSPIGFRGTNQLIPHYGVDILGTGTIADGLAGRMARGEQWLLKLRTDAQARFIRTGRLYGHPSEYNLSYRNNWLTITPIDISVMLDDQL